MFRRILLFPVVLLGMAIVAALAWIPMAWVVAGTINTSLADEEGGT